MPAPLASSAPPTMLETPGIVYESSTMTVLYEEPAPLSVVVRRGGGGLEQIPGVVRKASRARVAAGRLRHLEGVLAEKAPSSP